VGEGMRKQEKKYISLERKIRKCGGARFAHMGIYIGNWKPDLED
jgi:hypothetical protein